MTLNERIQIRRADPSDRELLESLLQFYIYDFSEFEDAGSDRLGFDSHGRFGINISLDPYWSVPGHVAYILLETGRPAGFALVNQKSHVGQAIDHNMAEFFVARKYRRGGVATAAFHQILALHPGTWEVAIIEPNLAAQKFWPTAIKTYGNASDVKMIQHNSPDWRGPIWTFVTAP